MLHVVEDDSNSILMVTAQERRQKIFQGGEGQYELSLY